MKRKRIYVDTSVLGGCFDPEFAAWSLGLLGDFRSARFAAVLSDVTAAEVARAPAAVRELHAELLATSAELVAVTDEVFDLLAAYEAHGVLPARFRNDMLHIALATIAQVDVLVSWNFRHIVRLDKIQRFNAVNLESGYQPLAIYSPREVTSYDTEPDSGG